MLSIPRHTMCLALDISVAVAMLNASFDLQTLTLSAV